MTRQELEERFEVARRAVAACTAALLLLVAAISAVAAIRRRRVIAVDEEDAFDGRARRGRGAQDGRHRRRRLVLGRCSCPMLA